MGYRSAWQPMTLLIACALALLGAPSFAYAKGEVIAKVHVAARGESMDVYVGGTLKYHWPVSTAGVTGYSTPLGTFHPQWRSPRAYSLHFRVWLLDGVYFDRAGDGVHAASRDEFNLVRRGMPASHGCIRLLPPDAKIFYDLSGAYPYRKIAIMISNQAAPIATKKNYARK
jgi:L,D-transpeptidase-like protein